MPATSIPQYLSVPDPIALSFSRRAAKPFTESAPHEPEGGQASQEHERALQQLALQGPTLQDRERAVQELFRALQERERALQERERALQQQAPPEPVNQYGFPRPGEQSPTPAEATGRHYFVDETNWQEILG